MSIDKHRPRPIPVFSARISHLYAFGNQGFTMIELILVMAIIGVLALMAIPAYQQIRVKVQSVRAVEEIRGIEKSVSAWSIDHAGNLPDNLGVLGLDTLLDPWGHNYVYYPGGGPFPEGVSGPRMYLTTPLNVDFDLYSKGKDGQGDAEISVTESRDDIVRSGEGGYVGQASELILAE
jgi:general secretion pathway protein G